jgi:hypothetical protein
MLEMVEYPEFIKFDLTLKNKLDDFFNLFEPYSEFSLVNLAVWLDATNNLELSNLNGNLVLRFDLPDKPNTIIYEFVGINKIEDSMLILLNTKNKTIHRIEAVPEYSVLPILNDPRFSVCESRNEWEYVYDSRDLSQLSSSEQARNRRKVHRFERENGEHSSITLDYDLSDIHNCRKIAKFTENLAVSDHNMRNDYARTELQAIGKTLKLASKLDIQSIVLSINDNIEGFITYHISQNNAALVSHIKVNYNFNNIFDYLLNIFAKHMYAKGINYINLEQDLGIEGLRTYKTRLHPVKMLKKYSVTLKK